MPVGIDDLNLYGSTLSVDALDIASARGFDPVAAARQGLLRRSLPPSWEDPVTMAVNAAAPLVQAAGADAFELLIVATESGVDYGKPISSYVHRYLGLQTRCRNLEVKHACYGGTAALQLATAWVRSGVAPGKKALVITSDMGRRMFGSLAEMTEGAGAVAMVVGEHPRVLQLDARSGYGSREIYDVSRPTPLLERGDPELSLAAYLDLLEIAWAEYRGNDALSIDRDFAAVLYHTPFVGLVRQAHAVLVEEENPDADADVVRESFERLVAPSLRYCAEVGNVYTGSLYAALAGLLDSDAAPPAGSRLGLFSYGSGSCAEFYSGTVAEGARELLASRCMAPRIAGRRRATIAEYEEIMHAIERGMTTAEFEPDRSAPAGLYESAYDGRNLLVLSAVRNFHRQYARS
jgi:3-hydroxy-3-methylglutaryl CoA synthase